MSQLTAILEHSVVYRLWQAPFANKKLEPIFRHNDITEVRRVLDVGCGPGTNTVHFTNADYLGIDFKMQYIKDARRRYKRKFIVADVTQFSFEPSQRFDFILLNSILHHMDTQRTIAVLSHLKLLLSEDGHIHALELVQPGQSVIANLLARWDRGKYPRPVSEWRQIFSSIFDIVVLEPYRLGAFGTILWNMIYFKGRTKR